MQGAQILVSSDTELAHLTSLDCPRCGNNLHRYTEDFVAELQERWSTGFDYSKVTYTV